ncbi:MAG: hypothetical protein ISN28_01095 [Ectothiorhodospiraceae bacterium AqS1]|nr:hypothetical protein [Ectothiorhodospiraceae bacterium AqS1]
MTDVRQKERAAARSRRQRREAPNVLAEVCVSIEDIPAKFREIWGIGQEKPSGRRSRASKPRRGRARAPNVLAEVCVPIEDVPAKFMEIWGISQKK